VVTTGHYFLMSWSQMNERIRQRRKLRQTETRKNSQDAVPL